MADPGLVGCNGGIERVSLGLPAPGLILRRAPARRPSGQLRCSRALQARAVTRLPHPGVAVHSASCLTLAPIGARPIALAIGARSRSAPVTDNPSRFHFLFLRYSPAAAQSR